MGITRARACASLAGLFALSLGSSALAGVVPQLFDNGAFITHEDIGANGADISRTETGTVVTFSISNNSTETGLPSRVIDDFVVPEGQTWDLSRLRFFATQSGVSSTESVFTTAVVRVYNVDPRGGGEPSVVGGDFSTNRLIGSSFSNVYRTSGTSSTANTSTTRPIWNIDADLSFLPPLAPGQYWIEFSTTGDLSRASPSSTFPVTPIPFERTGSHFFQGMYHTLSTQMLEVPFQLFGTPILNPVCIADVASPGQTPGADGELTADDIIVFIGFFFASDSRADVAGPGQVVGADGQFTADDIIVFIGSFFEGC